MIRSVSIALGMRVIGSGLWLIYTIVLARSLSQDQFGLALFVVSLILLATPIASMGFEISTLRHVTRYETKRSFRLMKQMVREGQVIALIGSIVVSCGIMALACVGYIPIDTGPIFLGLIFLGISISANMTLNRSTLRGQGNTAQSLLGFAIIRPTTAMCITFAFQYAGLLNATTAIFAYLLGLITALAVEKFLLHRAAAARQSRASRLAYSPGHLKRHLYVGFGVWPGEVSNAAVAKVGGLIVASFLGLEAAALYLAAERISTLAEFLNDAVRYGAAAEIASSADKGQQALQSSVTKASGLMLIAGVVGSSGLLLVGYFILGLMGDVYIKAYPILAGMIVGYFSRSVFGPVAIVMSMCGLEKEFSGTSFANAVVATALSVLGAVTLGLTGAVAGFAIAAWLNSFVLNRFVWIKLGIKCGLQSLTTDDLKQTKSLIVIRIKALARRLRTRK